MGEPEEMWISSTGRVATRPRRVGGGDESGDGRSRERLKGIQFGFRHCNGGATGPME